MKISDLPTRYSIPFANSAGGGFIRSVPIASQIGIQSGAASYTDGFPPLCFLPVGSGGIPPFGQDMNGVLNETTAWTRWAAAGGAVPWDSSFSAAVGGYPRGSIVASVTTPGVFWISTADDNTTNPDSAGAGWTSWPYSAAANQRFITSSQSFTVFAATLIVEGAAGGGAGGASANGSGGGLPGNIGGGGGSGGFFRKLITGLTIGSTISITIGAGGVAVSAAGGGNGGTTSFGAFCSATGGGGGAWGENTLGAGGTAGTATGGDVNIPGSPGGFAGTNSASVTASDIVRAPYGRGGQAAGGFSLVNISGTGVAGLGFGSGGGGASGGSGLAGANGAPGYVLIQG